MATFQRNLSDQEFVKNLLINLPQISPAAQAQQFMVIEEVDWWKRDTKRKRRLLEHSQRRERKFHSVVGA